MTHQAKTMICALFCIIINSSVIAGMENNGRGAKAVALANAFVAVADNPWAIAYNSAGLTQLRGIQCAAFIIPEQYEIPELRTIALATAIPLSIATIGLEAEQFGFDLYKETQIGFAFAKKLDENVSAGACVDLQHLSIERYGSTHSATLEIGLLAQVLDQVAVGFNFNNIMRATLGEKRERLPQVFTLGVRWVALDDFLLTLEMEKDVRYQTSVKAGIEQNIFSIVSLRAGVANNPDKFSVGFAARYSIFEFDYAGYSHNELGWTHQIEICFVLDK